MIHKGMEYRPGEIDEMLYEDFIDIAYGIGDDLRNTKLWRPEYRYGFVCPDEEGGWCAFAYDGSRHLFLGTFATEQVFGPEEEDWYDYRERMYSEADRAPSSEAIEILRKLYLDPRNKVEWSDVGQRIANDGECIRFLTDYWDYVRWCEHGNECSLSEIEFSGFIDSILEPEYVLDYLQDDDLKKRLRKLHRKYAGAKG